MRGFFEWLDTHAWSTALHESLYMYPVIETTHVLALTLFVGTLFVVDFRLLGTAFRDVPVSQVTARVLPWTVVGFVIIVSTGILLVYARPVEMYHNIWFRFKVVLLVIAGINAWIFHKRAQKNRGVWESRPKPPFSVRATAAVSVSTWIAVIFCGRLIAYNWFECYKPQPDWVVFLSGCIVEGS